MSRPNSVLAVPSFRYFPRLMKVNYRYILAVIEICSNSSSAPWYSWQWHCSHSMRQGQCNGRVSIRLSVCLSQLSAAAAACGGFAAVGPAGRRYRSIAAWPAPSNNGAAAARRSVAKPSSVTFTAGVGGWTRTCFLRGRSRTSFILLRWLHMTRHWLTTVSKVAACLRFSFTLTAVNTMSKALTANWHVNCYTVNPLQSQKVILSYSDRRK